MRQVQDMHSAESIWECMLCSVDLAFSLRNATCCPLWYQLREWSWGWYALGSDGSPNKEINARICKANQALGCLHAHVLNQHNNYVQCSCSHQPVAWMWDLYTPHKKALKSYWVLLGIKDQVTYLSSSVFILVTYMDMTRLPNRKSWKGQNQPVLKLQFPKPSFCGLTCCQDGQLHGLETATLLWVLWQQNDDDDNTWNLWSTFSEASFKTSFEGRERRAVMKSEEVGVGFFRFVQQKNRWHDHSAVFWWRWGCRKFCHPKINTGT